MELKVLYFGMIAEITKKREEILPVREQCNLNELRDMLISKYQELGSLSFKIAIDKKISKDIIVLQSTNEIALLPPFSGG
ncbi:hypothetical protein AB832_04080 [Flavobacteriaceae bacterium (ex Bugula neritina AB1)]|nr:hypothetical protein AB832_04080 [Flavobacteriaceae bacterium (ex Bugula neritina AB1)]